MENLKISQHVYADHISLISIDIPKIETAKKDLKSLYDMSDEGEVHFYLGIEFKRILSEKAILISHAGYIRTLLD